MRTTLTIDDDVLVAAKALAERQRKNVGEVVSELARRSLTTAISAGSRNGFPVLAARPGALPVTLEIVNALRDDTP